MLVTVSKHNRKLYETACAFERVTGSRCLCSLQCYGELHPANRFLLAQSRTGEPAAALYLSGNVLTITANTAEDPEEIVQFILQNGVKEVDTNHELASRLQALASGEIESSFYMMYAGKYPPEGDFSMIAPHRKLEDIFMVLLQSHEYYRTHLRYDSWVADTELRLRQGVMELFQLTVDGEPVGTGSIASMDDTCGVVAAVAVVPAHRGKGYGTMLSKFLTRRIIEMGKTPRLLSGYDAVAELYRRIGYTETGRWGELYL